MNTRSTADCGGVSGRGASDAHGEDRSYLSGQCGINIRIRPSNKTSVDSLSSISSNISHTSLPCRQQATTGHRAGVARDRCVWRRLRYSPPARFGFATRLLCVSLCRAPMLSLRSDSSRYLRCGERPYGCRVGNGCLRNGSSFGWHAVAVEHALQRVGSGVCCIERSKLVAADDFEAFKNSYCPGGADHGFTPNLEVPSLYFGP